MMPVSRALKLHALPCFAENLQAYGRHPDLVIDIDIPNEKHAEIKAREILNRKKWSPLMNCADAVQDILQNGGAEGVNYYETINTPEDLLKALAGDEAELVNPFELSSSAE